MQFNQVFVIMGVSGSGKTTVGRLLAQRLHLPFYDADDFHSPANIAKMRGGTPLTDEDRQGWLTRLAAGIRQWSQAEGAVLACSALKEMYRQQLNAAAPRPIAWTFLDGPEELVRERLQGRQGHYMNPALLASQFAALERPAYGLHLPIDAPPDYLVSQILSRLTVTTAEVGFIGLGVLGKSLALNLAEKGVRTALYQRHVAGKNVALAKQLAAENEPVGPLVGFDDLPAFVAALARPRAIFLLLLPGAAVDVQLAELLPLLTPGDVLIDGGNSYYKDTIRRAHWLKGQGIYFLGTGISGGEEGARRGVSIMSGGPREGYELVARYFGLLAAKDPAGIPCTTYIGPDGTGHFVKTVHNGLEYAEMQLLAEVYQLLRHLGLSPEERVAVLQDWQADADLRSYLLGSTIDMLQGKEGEDLLLAAVLKQPEAKGTGARAVQMALEYGVPCSIINEAVLGRVLAAHKQARLEAAGRFPAPVVPELPPAERQTLIHQLKPAYQASRILSHATGFELMQAASQEHGWNLNLAEIARVWTSGSIIRSGLMEQISALLPTTAELLASPPLVAQLQAARADLTAVVTSGLQRGVALPGLSAALNYFLSYTTANSPANLIQAQRDYFGAHTFRPADESFHADWHV
jgi:6-phosphogluconate dehydrogenase